MGVVVANRTLSIGWRDGGVTCSVVILLSLNGGVLSESLFDG